MHFEVLQAISVNGAPSRPNDDRIGAARHLAWVVDGATDLGPPGLLGAQGGAAWLATVAGNAFAATQAPDLRQTCTAVFAAIEARFQAERTRPDCAAWEVPKAAFAAAQLCAGQLQVAWAADSVILHLSGPTVRWATPAPDTAAEAADAQALGPGTGAAPRLSGPVLEDRRAHRGQDGHVALSALAAASARSTGHATAPVAVGDDILLMSDGFASLVSDYRRHSAQSLAAALHEGGLAPLLHEIRRIEQDDAACLAFPRFKVSDDASALWLRVAG